MIATLRAAASKAGVNPDRPLEHFMGRDDLDRTNVGVSPEDPAGKRAQGETARI